MPYGQRYHKWSFSHIGPILYNVPHWSKAEGRQEEGKNKGTIIAGISMDLIEKAKEVIEIEREGLEHLKGLIDEEFLKVVDAILETPGRVIVSGLGKSGLIGRKIAATFLSTGTPAAFLHPTEGMHGDLGAVMRGDIVMLVSNSGENREIHSLIPRIRSLGNKIIAMTGRPNSTLAKKADFVLLTTVEREADPNGLAPTTSCAAQLALGDALAIALELKRGFSRSDYARLHPGGTLGRRLILKVSDLMHSGDDLPHVGIDETFKEALFELTSKRMGAVAIVGIEGENKGKLLGIITDGDIKRFLEKAEGSINDLMQIPVADIMIKTPKSARQDAPAFDTLQYMEGMQISQLPVVDENGKLVGMLRLLDLIGAGLG
jgi:arabinose-5-phosphate isomerase